MEVHSYPTMLWGTAQRFIAAFEDRGEIKKLHLPAKENAKNLEDIVKDMELFFNVPAVELLSSNFIGACSLLLTINCASCVP